MTRVTGSVASALIGTLTLPADQPKIIRLPFPVGDGLAAREVVPMPGPRWIGRLLALLAFVALPALVAAPAGASQPQHLIVHQSGTFDPIDCGGGVVLTETFTEMDVFNTFVDASGTPTRVQITVHFDGVITNSASGNTYRDPGHFEIVQDVVNSTVTTVTFNGAFFAIVAPGAGIVVQDTGTITFDANGIISMAGHHEVLTGTAPDLCTVLV
jgi:hypothetical protein